LLLIRNEQMDVFRRQAIARFQDRMSAHLVATFPARYQSMPERDIQEFIRRGVKKGDRCEVKTEDAVRILLEMMTTFGEEFERSPDPTWIHEILAHPRLPGSLKVELIQDRFDDLIRGGVSSLLQSDES
jgi:hypothetical protein